MKSKAAIINLFSEPTNDGEAPIIIVSLPLSNNPFLPSNTTILNNPILLSAANLSRHPFIKDQCQKVKKKTERTGFHDSKGGWVLQLRVVWFHKCLMPVSWRSLHGHRLPEAFMNTHHHVPLPIITIMTSHLLFTPKQINWRESEEDDCITLWVTKRVDSLQFDWMTTRDGLRFPWFNVNDGKVSVPTVTRR